MNSNFDKQIKKYDDEHILSLDQIKEASDLILSNFETVMNRIKNINTVTSQENQKELEKIKANTLLIKKIIEENNIQILKRKNDIELEHIADKHNINLKQTKDKHEMDRAIKVNDYNDSRFINNQRTMSDMKIAIEKNDILKRNSDVAFEEDLRKIDEKKRAINSGNLFKGVGNIINKIIK